MLDVLNEDLHCQGRRAGGLRPRLPRRHLRHVRLHGERRGARAAARRPRCASSTCGISRMATSCISNRGAPGRSRWSKTWWWTAARSTASSPPAASFRWPPAARPTATPSWFRKRKRRTRHGCCRLHRLRRLRRHVPERVGVTVPAAKIAHLGLLPQGQPERDNACRRDGRAGQPRKSSELHQHRRMRSRLPQGHQAGEHCPHESRLHPRQRCWTSRGGSGLRWPGRRRRRPAGA